MAITTKQRASLRSMAHHLKPILQIGKEGLTESAINSVRDAFNTRELFKLKVQQGSPISAHEVGALLSENLDGVEHVQTIGRTVILYRRHPDNPEIEI